MSIKIQLLQFYWSMVSPGCYTPNDNLNSWRSSICWLQHVPLLKECMLNKDTSSQHRCFSLNLPPHHPSAVRRAASEETPRRRWWWVSRGCWCCQSWAGPLPSSTCELRAWWSYPSRCGPVDQRRTQPLNSAGRQLAVHQAWKSAGSKGSTLKSNTRCVQNLVSVQMFDVHLKADQRLHQGDGDVCVQVVPSAFKHRMSRKKGKAWRYGTSFYVGCILFASQEEADPACSYFSTLIRKRRSPGSPSTWGSPAKKNASITGHIWKLIHNKRRKDLPSPMKGYSISSLTPCSISTSKVLSSFTSLWGAAQK